MHPNGEKKFASFVTQTNFFFLALIVYSPHHQAPVIAAQSQIQDGHFKHAIQPLHIFKSGLVHEKCDYPKSCSS
jgi:hypothetical protein